MTKSLLLVVAACAAALSLRAVETKALPATDKAALVKEATALQDAVKTGKADVVIAKTHPAALKIFGTREAFEAATRQILTQMAAQGVKLDSVEVGEPTPAFAVGAEQMCFVPTTTVVSAGPRRVKSVGFLIAARQRPAGEWRFLDSASLQNNPDILSQLFPEFPKDAKLPPMKVEELK